MSQRIVIEPITRIEGHGKVTIILDDKGHVADARLHVTQFRGFEKFCEGRPLTEMPSLVERICGICPISHSLASAKACDAILGVKVPEGGNKLRKMVNCGTFIQSHALSFFHLSSPDLFLGMDTPATERNILGLVRQHPAIARDGIRLRQIGQQIIEGIAGKRIHPSWVVPGGVNAPLSGEQRGAIQALLPEALDITLRTLALFKKVLARHGEEIRTFANLPTRFMGLVTPEGLLDHGDGKLRLIDDKGQIVADQIEPDRYQEIIGEAVEPDSYLKSPYYKPAGYPEGIYRVGPAARLNICNGCGTEFADQEWAEFRNLERGPVLSSFHNHYARLIEILFCIETLATLLKDHQIHDTRVRSFARVNFSEGIGITEAPRGTLIHHYRVDENGLLTWANMIVATGHNNLAMNRGLLQVARHFFDGPPLSDGMINRIQAVIRAFDPCLSCSTHAMVSDGPSVRVMSADNRLLDER